VTSAYGKETAKVHSIFAAPAVIASRMRWGAAPADVADLVEVVVGVLAAVGPPHPAGLATAAHRGDGPCRSGDHAAVGFAEALPGGVRAVIVVSEREAACSAGARAEAVITPGHGLARAAGLGVLGS
jgi:hypothetical protein